MISTEEMILTYLSLAEDDVCLALGALEGLAEGLGIGRGTTKTNAPSQTTLVNELKELLEEFQVLLNGDKLGFGLNKAELIGVDLVTLESPGGGKNSAGVLQEASGKLPGCGGAVLLDKDGRLIHVEVTVNKADAKFLGQVVLQNEGLQLLLNEVGAITLLKLLGGVVERLNALEHDGVVLLGEHREGFGLSFQVSSVGGSSSTSGAVLLGGFLLAEETVLLGLELGQALG